MICPECGKEKDDDRVKAGMKCTECTYGGDSGRHEGVANKAINTMFLFPEQEISLIQKHLKGVTGIRELS